MEELRAYLEQVFCIELLSAVLSNPRDREKAFKGRIRPVLKKGNLVFQFEIFKGNRFFMRIWKRRQRWTAPVSGWSISARCRLTQKANGHRC